MNDTVKAMVFVMALCAVYALGYKDGAENELVKKAGDIATQASTFVAAIQDIPNRFNNKIDSVLEEVKSWFKWKRGPNGEIILDPDSALYGPIDSQLRERERMETESEPPYPATW